MTGTSLSGTSLSGASLSIAQLRLLAIGATAACAVLAACSTPSKPSNNTPYYYDATPFAFDTSDGSSSGGGSDSGGLPQDATDTTGADTSSNPCNPNPCTEANKTKCTVDLGNAQCECDAGFVEKDGKCVQGCIPPKKPPEPPKLQPGDLLVVELMINPQASSDDTGEWIELLNTTDKPLDINGIALTEAGKLDEHVVNHCKPLVVQPGGVIVLGNSANEADNGGYKPAYVYKDLALSNLNDDLLIQARYESGDILNIDHVKWDSATWGINKHAGHSLALDATQTTATGNDDRANWCLATKKMPGGDYGTPGVKDDKCPEPEDTDNDTILDNQDNCPTVPNKDQADSDQDKVGDVCDNCPDVENTDQKNADGDKKGDACDPSVCGDGELDLGEECDDGNLLANDGCESCKAVPPAAGGMVITEIMVWGGKVGSQWFEMYNPGNQAQTVNGWQIVITKGFNDKKIEHIINPLGALVVQPGKRVIIAASSDPNLNGFIKVDYSVNDKNPVTTDDLNFNTSGDTLTVIDPIANAVVDSVTFPFSVVQQTGQAWQVDPNFQSSTKNDNPVYWCGATTQFPKAPSLYGTPGADNTSCTPAGQDKDFDLVSNELDNCPFVANAQQADADNDKVGDKCDNCPQHPNGNQADTDGDGVGDACDNCPTKPNTDQKDDDKNGLGNACDPKNCGDKKLDGNEECDDGNKKSGDGCSETCTKEFFQPGAVIITEAMVQPQWSGDPSGEWIELFNPGSKPVDINGWFLRDNAANIHVIQKPGGLLVPAGGYLVLGNSADKSANGNLDVDYAWGGKDKPPTLFQMSNPPFSDEIILSWNQIVIDQVNYKPKGFACAQQPPPANCQEIGFSILPGKAMQLDPTQHTHLGNDSYQNWCVAKLKYGLGDLGTPGKPNTTCVNPCKGKADKTICGEPAEKTHCMKEQCVLQPQCGDKIVQQDLGEECDDGNKNEFDGCTSKCKNGKVIVDGTLIITEVMPDPDAIDDAKGEWFEVFNPTGKPIDMDKWTIISGTVSAQIKAAAGKPVVVQPNSYAVIAALSSAKSNNGVTALWGWSDGGASTFTIVDQATTPITLLNAQGQTVDTVTLNGPWAKGGSMMLKLTEECLSTQDNDKAACWVGATKSCSYGKLAGKTGLSQTCQGDQCTKDADCKKPAQVCKVIQPNFEGGAIICEVTNGNPAAGGTCVSLDRGTPGAKNDCK